MLGIDFYSLAYTTNQRVIQAVISSSEEFAKSYLAGNPNLSRSDVESLYQCGPEVRQALAQSANVPLDILKMLCADEDEDVRFRAVSNALTSGEDFHKALLNGKFSAHCKKAFAWNLKAVATLETFELLWKMKSARSNLVDAARSAEWRSKPVDSGVHDIIHNYMRSGEAPKIARKTYASCSYADPAILDDWKNDPDRPIINAIAENGSAWVSTHEHLIDNHKTPALRIFIARVTKDKGLLDKIYYGTKNEEIRASVRNNPLFVA